MPNRGKHKRPRFIFSRPFFAAGVMLGGPAEGPAGEVGRGEEHQRGR